MYFTFFLLAFAFILAPSTGADDECMRLGHPHALHCCKSLNHDSEKMETIKECFKDNRPPKPPAPPTCDLDICIGQKLGYSDDKGTIDKKVLAEVTQAELKDQPGTFEKIKTNCIDGDVSAYGPPDACDLMKMKHCIENQIMLGCTEWDDKPHCDEIKQKVEQCKG